MSNLLRVLSVLALVSGAVHAAGVQEKLLRDIETEKDIAGWDKSKGQIQVVEEGDLRGKASLKVDAGSYFVLFNYSKMVGDWSGYDVLAVDFNNPTGKPLKMSILVADKDWEAHGRNYWNRHNSNHVIPPGKWTFKLPLQGLYRGEAGSRYSNLKHAIKTNEVVRFDMGIGAKADEGHVYIDNFRLLKAEAPEGVRAFDFGPTEQNVTMGYQTVTWDSVYDKAKGYGLNRALWGENRARDDTFPPGTFLRDWIGMSEKQEDWEFMVDLPNGTYHVWTVHSDLGYWGGEWAKHRIRKIWAEGKEVHSEDHGEKGHAWRVHHLFEDVEPLPGDDFWDLYCSKLFKPVRFTVEVTDGQLNLKWHADQHFSCKVAGIVIYPDGKKAEGDAYVDALWKSEREAFRVAAAMAPTPTGGTMEAVPAEEKAKGWLFFKTDYTDDTYLTTVPVPAQFVREAAIFATRNELEPVSFAVRPLKDLGQAKVVAGDLTGPGGAKIPGSAWDIRVVRHLSRRGFSAIGYRIIPQMLKPFETVALPAGWTREFWATVRVPADAASGAYTGIITLSSDKGLKEEFQVSLHVLPIALDGSDYVFGFFGEPPNEGVAKLLVDYGINSFSGGPRIGLSGFDKDGKPQMDFAKMDEFMTRMKAAGYKQELCGYGGPSVEHVGYHKENGFFDKWEKATGKSYVELLKAVFDEVQAHAKEKEWLPFTYNLCDEPRNAEYAKQLVDQMKAIAEAAPWLKTTGQYSVTKGNFEKAKDYHAPIFYALKSSGLNNHDQTTMDKAKELGKEIYIYNQGQSRYSFGAYQWSEYRKGVKGRYQWHQHVQHGFQFFDLDGREPDTGVLYYGKDGPIPTLALERSREGADDFYYCQTLWNLAEKTGGELGNEAKAWLEEWTGKIKIAQRNKPDWLSDQAIRAKCAAYILKLKGQAVPAILEK